MLGYVLEFRSVKVLISSQFSPDLYSLLCTLKIQQGPHCLSTQLQSKSVN